MSLQRLAAMLPKEVEEVEEDFDIFENPPALDLYDEEIRRVLEEMKYGAHADSEEYKRAAEALKNLSEARTAYAKAKTEQDRVDAQRMADKAKQSLDLNQLIPILLKAGFAVAVIVFWIGLEQGRPVPRSLSQWTTNLLIPR